jgi:hypothetical protein
MIVVEASAISAKRVKSGIRQRKATERQRRDRDVWLLDAIYAAGQAHKEFAAASGAPMDALTVYVSNPFPLQGMYPDKVIPTWNRLSAWMKVQLFIMLMAEYDDTFITFSVNIHPSLLAKWQNRKDIAKLIGERARKEVTNKLGSQVPFFFLLEGRDKVGKEVKLHIHGGALTPSAGQQVQLIDAIGRACGQGIGNRRMTHRARDWAAYRGGKGRYGNYITKNMQKNDHRISDRKLFASRAITQAAAEFWDLVRIG